MTMKLSHLVVPITAALIVLGHLNSFLLSAAEIRPDTNTSQMTDSANQQPQSVPQVVEYSGALRDASENAVLFLADGNGVAKVKLGTADGDFRLDMDAGAGAQNVIRVFRPGENIFNLSIDGAENSTLFLSDGTGAATIKLSTAGDTYLTGGNLGIGTVAPADLLQVAGDIRAGTAGANGCLKVFDATVITGTCSSDARFKKNIVGFGPMVDKVSALRPVHFDWRVDEFPAKQFGEGRSFGLIAQEAEKVLPELVTEDAEGYKAVRYNKLPLLNTQAIGELKAENDALRAELAQLRTRLGELQSLIEPLWENMGTELSDARPLRGE